MCFISIKDFFRLIIILLMKSCLLVETSVHLQVEIKGTVQDYIKARILNIDFLNQADSSYLKDWHDTIF